MQLVHCPLPSPPPRSVAACWSLTLIFDRAELSFGCELLLRSHANHERFNHWERGRGSPTRKDNLPLDMSEYIGALANNLAAAGSRTLFPHVPWRVVAVAVGVAAVVAAVVIDGCGVVGVNGFAIAKRSPPSSSPSLSRKLDDRLRRPVP
eukprot:7459000-Pyramimonas_sp.AAC.1